MGSLQRTAAHVVTGPLRATTRYMELQRPENGTQLGAPRGSLPGGAGLHAAPGVL